MWDKHPHCKCLHLYLLFPLYSWYSTSAFLTLSVCGCRGRRPDPAQHRGHADSSALLVPGRLSPPCPRQVGHARGQGRRQQVGSQLPAPRTQLLDQERSHRPPQGPVNDQKYGRHHLSPESFPLRALPRHDRHWRHNSRAPQQAQVRSWEALPTTEKKNGLSGIVKRCTTKKSQHCLSPTIIKFGCIPNFSEKSVTVLTPERHCKKLSRFRASVFFWNHKFVLLRAISLIVDPTHGSSGMWIVMGIASLRMKSIITRTHGPFYTGLLVILSKNESLSGKVWKYFRTKAPDSVISGHWDFNRNSHL